MRLFSYALPTNTARRRKAAPTSVAQPLSDVDLLPLLASAPIPISTPALDYHASFLIPLFVVLNTLCWPWIIFGYVWFNDGVAAYQSVATYVVNHGQYVSYLATLSGSFFAALTTALFLFAIVRFSQKWFDQHREVDVFHISFFMTLRYQFFPWSWTDRMELLSRWYLIVIVGSCIFTIHLIPSGISAIVAPITIQKVIPVNGSELDIGSQNSQCIEWLRTRPDIGFCAMINSSTLWSLVVTVFVIYKDIHTYNSLTCLGQILSYGNNNQSQVLNELGGVQFVTPLQGVLPIGPNGVPGFNTLSPLDLPDSRALARSLTYNYTLGLQGIESDIRCSYDTSSPVIFNVLPEYVGLYVINGTCPAGLQDFLGQPIYLTIESEFELGFWACGNGTRDDDGFQSYVLYLAGHNSYNTTIANITCSLSMQSATYSTTYNGQSGSFSTARTSEPPSTLPSLLINQAVEGLGALVPESQGSWGNLMAESVITLGTKLFGLPVDRMDDLYLRLFEAMLLGVLEYETTYTRLIYTSYTNETSPAPAACVRTVDGSMTYQVIGWRYSDHTIAFLLPMTFINLSSFILLIIAMSMGEKVLYPRDPTDMRAFFMAPSDAGPGNRGRMRVDLYGEPVFTPASERKSFFGEGPISPTSVGPLIEEKPKNEN